MSKRIGKRLKQLRKLNNYSAEYVIKKLNEKNVKYSVQSLYKWEEGTVKPNIYILESLAQIYKCSLNYFLTEDIEHLTKLTAYEMVLIQYFRQDSNFRNIATLLSERAKRKK